MIAEDTPLALDRLGYEFCRVLRALGNAGEPQTASQHAARAWWAVRDVAPSLADHINGVMHHLARLEAGTTLERSTTCPSTTSTSATNRPHDVTS